MRILPANQSLNKLAISTDEESRAATSPDPFDLANLRLSQDFLETGGVKKLLLTVPVRKPGKHEFIRVHPGPGFRAPLAAIELKDEDRDFYIVTPNVAGAIDETIPVTAYTAITRSGAVFIWPCRMPGPDGRDSDWWRSAHTAATIAMSKWIRIKSNMSLGAYEVMEATAAAISEPQWPDEHDFQSLLRIAFRDRLITDLDHPVLKRLRGEA